MSAGPEDSMRDLFDGLHDGWTNRETYAAFLHLTADEGLELTTIRTLQTAKVVVGPLDADRAGRIAGDVLLRFLYELDDAQLEEEFLAICSDIGSLRHVNWTEVGAAFLADERIAA